MQTYLAQSAFRRGLRLFAGMLAGLRARPSTHEAPQPANDLVSWCSPARTRRGDEMARSRQMESLH
jgi:hypothetical protein